MISLKIPAASRAINKSLLAQARAMHKGSIKGLNRAAVKNRNDGSRIIRQTLNVRAAFVKKQMRVKKASDREMRAAVQTTYKPVPLIRFNGISQPKSGGISVRMRKDKPRIRFRSGFISSVPNTRSSGQAGGGHTGAFVRFGAKRQMTKGRYKGKFRQPIKELYGPSVYTIFAEKTNAIVQVGDTYLSRYIGEEIESQLKRRF